jgi:hypothetical protein
MQVAVAATAAAEAAAMDIVNKPMLLLPMQDDNDVMTRLCIVMPLLRARMVAG